MTARTGQELSILQEMLEPSNADVTLIEQDVMAEQTTYRQRLIRYQQQYIQALSQGLPLSPLAREALERLQQQLGLSHDEVKTVESLVKQGALSQQPPQQALQSELFADGPSKGEAGPPQDAHTLPQHSASQAMDQAVQLMPPGAVPSVTISTHRQEATAISSEALLSEPIASEGGASAVNVPTLFDDPTPSPTQLSTAPVVPTPLGSPTTPNILPTQNQPGFQDSRSNDDNVPTSLTPPVQPPQVPPRLNKVGSSVDGEIQTPEEQHGREDGPQQETLQARIEQYEVAFAAAVDRKFPVSERDRQALHHLQHLLELSDDQVRPINQHIADQVNQQEAYYHTTKMQTYAQQFVSFMEQDWPLSSANQESLAQLQQQLELHDADVKALEHQIVAQHLAKAAAPLPQDAAQDPKRVNHSDATATALASTPITSNPSSLSQDHEVTELMSGPEASMNEISTTDSTPSISDPLSSEISQASLATAAIASEPTASEPAALKPIVPNDLSGSIETPSPNLASLSSETSSSDLPSVAPEPVLEPQRLLPTELESPDDSEQLSPLPFPDQQTDAGLSSINPVIVPSPAPSSGVRPLTERDIDYVQLETYLRTQEWKKADEETLDLMRKATARRVEWLDRQAILELPCADLKTIDALWYQHSQGRFGFRVQQELFKITQASNSNVARFGKQVGWTLWQSEFIGFKYYKQLIFDLSAPPGHLPAKWFWMIPWWESVRSGGLGMGRGGCGDDASEMLSAMMYQFLECSTQG